MFHGVGAGAMTIVHCLRCQAAYGVSGDVPLVCQSCHQATRWAASPSRPEPAWALTTEDARLLAAFHISKI